MYQHPFFAMLGYAVGSIPIRWLFILILVANIACAEEINYSQKIQPIFAQHCLKCHGPDQQSREADLQLEVESSAKESAIVAGHPNQSELYARITSSDPDLRMPPSAADALSKPEIDLLRQWIAEGAKYEKHWSFHAIRNDIEAPDLQHELPLSDIDKFIVAKLQAKGLSLSKAASKEQLIRRATFDLTGLPPSWDEVTSFVNDTSTDAFEKVVRRLLDSPGYGERWGKHWLDLARYADTHGGAAIGFKKFPFSYTYRDYVIQSFARHTPFNDFITRQLAADQLELSNNSEHLAALGFLTVGMQFRNPHDTVDDQIDVVTRGLMGVTVSCARCHDHKFDPISTQDYYSLYAIFAGSEKPAELPIIGDSNKPKYDEYKKSLEALKISRDDHGRDQTQIMRGRLCMQVGLYLREIAKGTPEPDLVSADVLSYRTEDLRPQILHRWQNYIRNRPSNDGVFGPWVQLSTPPEENATFPERSVQLIAKLKKENGNVPSNQHRLSSTAPKWNPRVLKTIEKAKPKSLLELADAYGKLFGEVHREWLTAQLEASLEAIPGTTPIPDEDPKHLAINSAINRQLRRHLYGPNSPISIDEQIARRLLNRPINDNQNGRRGAIDNLNLTPDAPPRAMVMQEKKQSGPFYVFERGNPRSRGDQVVPRFPTVLSHSNTADFDSSSELRRQLARAITDSHNPLTRRVIVNWVWLHHFGQGIVRTPDDFGTRGEPPTHPELLDFLANRFMEEDWSLRWLHEQIMLSQVYQQAAIERPDARRADPDNRLLWRMPRHRLSFEAMRDAMLWASGELSPGNAAKNGSTKNGSTKEGFAKGIPFELLSKPTVPRRTVYAFVNRDIVNPLMSTFDSANPNACTAKRPKTSVPQQTLFALNSEFVQDRAAALAKLVSSSDNSDSDKVRTVYRRLLSREPDEDEVQTALGYIAPPNAQREKQSDDEPTRWQLFVHALLASNEFMFLD